MSIRVGIVDDHKIFREGIGVILNQEKDIDVIWSADNFRSTLENIDSQEIDVLLLDISLGIENGIQIAEQIINNNSDIKIIALTMHYEDDYIIKMLKLGARGYLLKDCSSSELVKSIHVVYDGSTYYSDHVNNVLIEHIKSGKPNGQDKKAPITKREREVLKLVAEEYSNSEIAEQLFISIRTVDTHKRNLIEKLKVKNAVGLVRYAIKNNIVEIE